MKTKPTKLDARVNAAEQEHWLAEKEPPIAFRARTLRAA